MDQLAEFLAQNPLIHHATPQSPDYEELRLGFLINESKSPAIIIRPRSAEEVAALMPVLTKNKLPFAVRVGGHDMFGRSQIADGVTIDLREIAHVEVDHESETARIGGGVLTLDMLAKLHQQNVVTPYGMTPSVGHVGWATFGGYGLLSSKYGLGVDQIVGAKIVDAEGRIRDADETMLTGIRGGGGFIGVIVELTVKVYPADQILAGIICYNSTDLASEIRQFNAEYSKAKQQGLPSSLHLYQAVLNGPTGKGLSLFFMWSSPNLEEGQQWLSKVSSWLPVAMSTVQPTTYKEFSEFADSMLPKHTYGTIFAINLYDLTPEVLDAIGIHGQKLPDGSKAMLGLHELRADAPRKASFDTVFDNRRPHYLLEMVPLADKMEAVDEIIAWGREVRDAIRKTDPTNIAPSTYIPLTSNDDINMDGIYGSRHEMLKKIKKQYDPDTVFNYCLPRF